MSAANAEASARRRPGRPATITRERLLDAAREVITERGYRGASISAIAEQAGISNGALYRYFPSKVELFVEVFRDVCDREIRAAAHAAEPHAEPLEKLDAMLVNFATRALQSPTLAWALIAEPVDPAIEAVRLEYRRRYRRGIEHLLTLAITQNTIPEQDTAITAAALLGGGSEVLAGPLSPLADEAREPGVAIAELQRMMAGAVRRAWS